MKQRITNTLEGRSNKSVARAIFSPKLILFLVVLGVFSFGAFFTLAGFSKDLKSGNNGGTHALSKSATGYGALLSLLKQNNENVDISRSLVMKGDERKKVRIVSLTTGSLAKDIDEIVINSPTLIILPKWNTRPLKKKNGWVEKLNKPFPELRRRSPIVSSLNNLGIKAEIYRSKHKSEKLVFDLSADFHHLKDNNFYGFEKLQTIKGEKIAPLIAKEDTVLLGRIKDKNLYIMADPDFFNSIGLTHPDRAEYAYKILKTIQAQTDADGFIFDLSAHGFSKSRNLIKLALTPPFLAVTLCLLAMGLLGAWQAVVRFGDPTQSGREIALGKFSLIENAAGFIKLDGREYKMAPDYVELVKKTVARKLGLPANLPEKEMTKRLDLYCKHADSGQVWSEIEAEKNNPKDAAGLMKLARKLYKWRGEITHADK